MKKILFVATTARSHINIFHLPHINFFKNNYWQVHVVTNGDEKVVSADKEFSLPIFRGPFHFGNLIAIFKLITIMKKEKYDLISSHTPMGGVVARIAAFFAKTSPVIYFAHGFHFYNGAPFMNCIYKFVEMFLARITDAIITMNEEDFVAAKKFKLRGNGQVFKIPGIGLDTKKFLSVSRQSKKQLFGLNEDAIVILNVAEMIKRKNQKILLVAFSKINCEHAYLVICGRGKLEKKLMRLAVKLNISHKVKFLGFRKDIPEILAASDIFVFPSFQEGLPLAIMEAMASKLPIVCSDIRGNKDLISENKNRFLLDCLDINGFARKIYLLCNDKSLRIKMGNTNQAEVLKYGIENVIRIMKNIYEQVLN